MDEAQDRPPYGPPAAAGTRAELRYYLRWEADGVMSRRSTDPAYLRYQYGTAEKLNIRIESHKRYSEQALDFHAWVLQWLDLAPGLMVLDVGCGSGVYHRTLGRHDVRIIACDRSPGVAQEVMTQAEQHRLPVVACQAEAEALPFAAGSCDRVMANHMLYHVPIRSRRYASCAAASHPTSSCHGHRAASGGLETRFIVLSTWARHRPGDHSSDSAASRNARKASLSGWLTALSGSSKTNFWYASRKSSRRR